MFKIIKGKGNYSSSPEEQIESLKKMSLSKNLKTYLLAYQWYVKRSRETHNHVLPDFKEYRRRVPLEEAQHLVKVLQLQD